MGLPPIMNVLELWMIEQVNFKGHYIGKTPINFFEISS